MKRIILVRHAKSSWKNDDLSDFERPLNDRGKRDVITMGERFKKYRYRPDVMVSSPAKRAKVTAKGLAEAIEFPEDKMLLTDNLYMASERIYYEILHEMPNKIDTAMLVSHNPGTTHFINHVSDAFIDNVPTLGIGVVEFDIGDWRDVASGSGKLVLFDFPKNTQSI